MEELVSKSLFDRLRERVELIERSLRREVGPALDVVETAAGVVASVAAGGAVGKVADVVEKVVDAVKSVCNGHPDAPAFCGRDGCPFSPQR